ncbi:hypothetical protein AVEN_234004-1 [Araneus ventricosus]|uniref:Uncharacterized protein n=1 Tax=Araneus ventricosus TaxID=182803 RepID=A0A4Y2WH75_ARAVE|nr:hypothetical protein AVEN_167248-1 [Araneus ventricosus]GBO35947.1 hypothetical protein AVEN_182728-1 [Araneus ventricosus]GBO40133.1 hypothetical protein AVEN_148399-1 [Araneus ventricosus]GBO41005.1 hypothetical protein AVEN_234004-1 [Araneus ventricosus]
MQIVRSPKIPQIISGNFFSHAMSHRTEQVPQREVLIKTPPKGAGFELAPSVCSLVDVMKRVNYLEHEKPLATEGQAQKRVVGCPKRYKITKHYPHSKATHTEIFICSSFAVHVCELTGSLTRQDRKFITSLKQVITSFEVTIRQTCCKLVASSSLQTSYKKRIRIRTKDSKPRQLGYQPVSLTTTPVIPR